MNPNRKYGVTSIAVNGTKLETAPKPTFQPGGVQRTAVESDNGAGRFSEMPLDSRLEVKVLIGPGVSMRQAQAWDDVTLTVELDTGQTYVVNHAYTAEAVEANDGGFNLVMAGPEAEELSL
jgi:hypothetical protein